MRHNPAVRMGIALFQLLQEGAARWMMSRVNDVRLKKAYQAKTPPTLTLLLTNSCNAACRHCFYWEEVSKEKSELSVSEIRKLLKTLQRVKMINLTGGEPFLRRDLLEIAQMCVAFGIKTISIPTNGMLTDRITDFVLKMSETPGLKLLKINVSLDGPEATHDRIRNLPGCFCRALKTIENLKQIAKEAKNFQVSTSTVVSQDNMAEMTQFIPWLFKQNLPIIVSVVRGAERHVYNRDRLSIRPMNPRTSNYLKSHSDLDKLKDMLEKNANRFGSKNWNIFQQIKFGLMVDIIKNGKKRMNCLAGYTDGVVFNNGDVALCEYTRPVGNLRDVDMDFQKIWLSEAADRMRRQSRACFCIHTCNLVSNMQYDADLMTEIVRSGKL